MRGAQVRMFGGNGWADPRRMAAPGGARRAHRLMLIMLGLQRLSYLAVPAIGLTADGVYRSVQLNAALLAVTIGWNVVLFQRSVGRGWFAAWSVWVDVVWAAVLFVVLTWNAAPGQPFGTTNWSGKAGTGAATLAAAALDPVAHATAAVCLLVVARVALAVVAFHGLGQQFVPQLLSYCSALVSFAAAVGFGMRYLRRQGQLLDRLAAERLAAESRRAAEAARSETRLAHHRMLHDTVLTTLTAVARGGLADEPEGLRRRCAREVDRIRRMLLDDANPAPTALTAALAETVDAAEALGLRVHVRHDVLPAALPGAVVEALDGAAREALNNVARHAEAGEAWLTVTTEDGAVVVRVVDRGRGFDPAATPAGFGLDRSVVERVRGVAGEARVVSGPGEGTCVELVWRP